MPLIRWPNWKIVMLELEPRYLAMVRNILRHRLPEAKAWAFGSRVQGTARKFSDLDIALEAPTLIDSRTLALLRDDLVESDLPIAVDVLDLKAISQEFRAAVERTRVPIMPV